jgi:hypothetical protein
MIKELHFNAKDNQKNQKPVDEFYHTPINGKVE